ncbi:hypothetical protein BGL34_04870 [Fructilactobacillus lindneri]|uniref:Regulatory protein YycH domain-containing protein n=1 Tax=Fructilactobacillus lindneri TaxID=53444 RepID=A0AB33BJ47_9LACO|nr:hypothetical protein AYR60_01430 [Fructilactobacillus lindneri]POH23639.1 hypothetical protein BHU33_05155 [Fructilactobacillus lindneri DSM 20690 = JCM 11027]ANZ59808.1 hypothetical protein AYR59_01430 [Fructilactobacillus lindneri]POG97719.1 hypothetical protein BGL31_06325 [Fructilactobacillus lindneri]POH00111.1 hypothetical protein BGL32_04890 [Fructilactobacillus lindneri]
MSVSLLTNPARFSNNNHPKQKSALHNDINSRNFLEVYSPTQIIQTDRDGKQQMLTSPTTNLVGEILKNMDNYHFSKIKRISTGNQQKYLDKMNYHDSLMLNYNSSISSNIIGRILHYSGFNGKEDINRIVLPIDDNNRMYLLSDQNHTIYQVNVKSRSLAKIHRIIRHDVTKDHVEMRLRNGRPFLYFPGQVKMKDYGYLLQEQSQSLYLSRIIGNTTNATIKHHKNSTTYNSSDQGLTFSNDGNVIYNNYQTHHNVNNQEEALEAAYRNAIQLGVPLDNTKFDSYTNKDKAVNYRFFIEGFPLYGSEQLGSYSYRFINGNTERYKFSLRDFQIPVPTNRQTTILPSTRNLLRDLKNDGVDMSKVTDVKLGYQIIPDKQNNLLVTLQSTWFVKYHNKWVNYKTLSPHYQAGKENF